MYESIEAFRDALTVERASGRAVGFVPTMGALHAGHLSLVHRARQDCDVVALSIFVNPLQFGQNEDLSRYPRPFEVDREFAEGAGVSHLFAPTLAVMYPPDGMPIDTVVDIPPLTNHLEGQFRPGHLAGVATVCTKLFSIAGPCRAYFGEKDWQQLAVVARLVADLSFPVEVIGCTTIREPDGLAMSSRNVYLDPQQRLAATSLYRALEQASAIASENRRSGGGGRAMVDADLLRGVMREVLESEPLIDVQYAEVIDEGFQPCHGRFGESARLVIAAKVGDTRLIDNRSVGRG